MMNEFGTSIFLQFAKFILNSEDAPIHLSVARGNINEVEQHLKTSNCINESQFGYTPLQLSLSKGHDDISHLLHLLLAIPIWTPNVCGTYRGLM